MNTKRTPALWLVGLALIAVGLVVYVSKPEPTRDPSLQSRSASARWIGGETTSAGESSARPESSRADGHISEQQRKSPSFAGSDHSAPGTQAPTAPPTAPGAWRPAKAAARPVAVEAIEVEEEDTGSPSTKPPRGSDQTLPALGTLYAGYYQLRTPEEKVDFLRQTQSETGAKSASPLLLNVIAGDPSAEARQEALSAASFIEAPNVLQQALQLALRQDQPIDVRLQALNLSASTLPSMLDAYKSDPNPDVRSAAELLIRLRDSNVPLPVGAKGYKIPPKSGG